MADHQPPRLTGEVMQTPQSGDPGVCGSVLGKSGLGYQPDRPRGCAVVNQVWVTLAQIQSSITSSGNVLTQN